MGERLQWNRGKKRASHHAKQSKIRLNIDIEYAYKRENLCGVRCVMCDCMCALSSRTERLARQDWFHAVIWMAISFLFHFIFSPPLFVCNISHACQISFSPRTLWLAVWLKRLNRESARRKNGFANVIFFFFVRCNIAWMKIENPAQWHGTQNTIDNNPTHVPKWTSNQNYSGCAFRKSAPRSFAPWIDFNHNLYFGSPSLATALFFFFSIYFSANYK